MIDEELDAMLKQNSGTTEVEEPHLAVDVLLDLARGRLDTDQRASAEAHLASCLTCRELGADLGEPIPDEMVAAASRALEPKRTSRWIAVAGGLAVVAAIALLVAVGPSASTPIAHYEMSALRGGVQSMRSAPAQPSTLFTRDNRLEVNFAPDVSVAASRVELAAYIASGDEPLERVDPRHIMRTENGAFRLRAEAGRLVQEEGPYTLHAFIGAPRVWPDRLERPSALPNAQHFSAAFRLSSQEEN